MNPIAFLGAAGLKGIANWIWIAIVSALIAAIWAVVAIADRRHENALQTAAKGGAAASVVAGQAQTFNQLGDANHAEQDLRSSGERSAQRHADCLRDSRDRTACERYRPLP